MNRRFRNSLEIAQEQIKQKQKWSYCPKCKIEHDRKVPMAVIRLEDVLDDMYKTLDQINSTSDANLQKFGKRILVSSIERYANQLEGFMTWYDKFFIS